MGFKILKHNPAFLSDDELSTQFVVRHQELAQILDVIRANDSEVNQHLLIVAPRGMGKTMLVRRVGLAIKRDSVLSKRWYPIILPEESYTVTTEGEFWLHVLKYSIKKEDTRWQKIIKELDREKDDGRLCEQAIVRLKEFSDQHKCRLVVIVENLNSLLDEQIQYQSNWDLRKTLLNESYIMLLTTATQRFDEIDKVDMAMYELFREIKLRPIKSEESIILWKNVTGESLESNRIRPFEILTGGNPRLLSILASFTKGTSFRALMDDLINLVDDHTSYFKSNTEALPAVERKVFLTLAEIWTPTEAREIANKARININKTSSLLKRLVTRGVVEVDKNKKKHTYQIVDRLYNIYLIMRQNSYTVDRVKAMVEFMIRFYADATIGKFAQYKNLELAEQALKAKLNKGKILYDSGIIDSLIHLAAKGFEREILNLISLCSADLKFEPLFIALKMLLNEEYRAPQEVVEVAKDVQTRILELRKRGRENEEDSLNDQ